MTRACVDLDVVTRGRAEVAWSSLSLTRRVVGLAFAAAAAAAAGDFAAADQALANGQPVAVLVLLGCSLFTLRSWVNQRPAGVR